MKLKVSHLWFQSIIIMELDIICIAKSGILKSETFQESDQDHGVGILNSPPPMGTPKLQLSTEPLSVRMP